MDLVTTLIGFRLGLVESNPTGIALLKAWGWPALVALKVGVIIVGVTYWRVYLNPRWEKIGYVPSVVLTAINALIAFFSVYYVATNIEWILLKVLGFV